MEYFIHSETISRDLFEDDDNFQLSETDGLKFLHNTLQGELEELKSICIRLNKSNGYLETAKKNMNSRKVQEETLEERIQKELGSLN